MPVYRDVLRVTALRSQKDASTQRCNKGLCYGTTEGSQYTGLYQEPLHWYH
ncbi:hypothetical protein DPMN_168328 [Dreissena polymorpha]|uniref:Uncharacterized protein n=1 Tax=Dreissena polymorpha TaxID=45954 RepID=A0A9D4F1R1_DREPO|nr:hypothetical protein DPMN_168328 [Dreissena polymorpha]